MIKYLFSCLFSSLLFAFAVHAADVGNPSSDKYWASRDVAQPDAAPGWSGPYLGLFGVYGWSHRETSLNDGFDSAVFDPGTQDADGRGVLGGALAGFNVQSGRFVFGAEADIAATRIDGELTAGTEKYLKTAGKDGTAWNIRHEIDYLGTLRGRAGFTMGDKLLFLTAGAAWARVDETHAVFDGPKLVTAPGQTEDHFGWTAGGGFDYALGGGWAFRTEYLYFRFDDADYSHDVGNKSGAPDVTSSDLELHTVRAGLNYRF